MLKILQTTNVDFGRSFAGENVEGDRLRAGIKTSFSKIIDTALSKSVDIVIIGGNTFFNNDISQHTLDYFASEIKRLNDIPAVIIPGANDAYEKGSFSDYLIVNPPAENLYVLASSGVSSLSIPSIKTSVYGIPQNTIQTSPTQRIEFNNNESNKYHIALTFVKDNKNDDVKMLNSSLPILAGFHYIAIGGIEDYRGLIGDGLKGACSGSPFVFSPDCESNKGVLIAEIETDSVLVNSLPIESFVWQELEISMDSIIDAQDIKNKIQSVALPNKLLKVKFTGLTLLDTGLNFDLLKEELENDFLQLTFDDYTSVLPKNVSEVKVHDKTMLGQYLKIMVNRINTAEDNEKAQLEESLKTGYSLLSGRAVGNMRLSHLILKDFGRFENFECNFSPGINLIKGPSEAGKSTLVDALTTALFRDPSREQDNSLKMMRWGGETAPFLEAVFNVQGLDYKLKKDYTSKQSEVAGAESKVLSEGQENISQWISDNLGISSEDIFKATACVNQGDIAQIDNSIEAIKDKLESLVIGNKEDIAGSEAIKKIDERIVNTTMESVKFNSANEGIEYNISKIQREIEALRSKRTDLVQLETAFRNLCDDLVEKKDKLEKDIRAIDVLEKYKNLEAGYKNTDEKLRRGKVLYSDLEKLRELQTDFKKVTSEDLQEVEDVETAYQYELNVSKEVGTELAESKEELNEFKMGIFGTILSIIGVLGVAFSVTSNYITIVEQFTPYIWHSLGGSLLVFLLGMSMYNNKKQIKKQLSNKVEKNQKKFNDNYEELKGNKDRLAELLKRYRVSNSHELRKDFWRYEEFSENLNKATNTYTDHMQGEIIEDLIERFRNDENEFRAVESEYLNIEDNDIDKSGIERDKLIISQLEESKADLEQERKVIRQKIDTAESGSELLASYQERKERHNLKLESFQKEVELLGLTKTCIEEARQNVLVSKLEVLNKATSEILSSLTSGKYSEVRFDESDLKFQVLSNEKGDWINPEDALSTSTIEQIYLAARLALTDLISENRNSLLILDEPFSDYDDSRLENAMKVLKNMSEDHQILLLTSKNKYDQWADATITL